MPVVHCLFVCLFAPRIFRDSKRSHCVFFSRSLRVSVFAHLSMDAHMTICYTKAACFGFICCSISLWVQFSCLIGIFCVRDWRGTPRRLLTWAVDPSPPPPRMVAGIRCSGTPWGGGFLFLFFFGPTLKIQSETKKLPPSSWVLKSGDQRNPFCHANTLASMSPLHPTGATIWDDYFNSAWNVLFTQLPIMAVCIFDKDFRFQETLLEQPELYKEVSSLLAVGCHTKWPRLSNEQ